MNKRIYRYFGGFLEKQGRFLNEMSAKGYRLVKTGELLYEFEQCTPGKYEYCVEFVADKSYKEIKEYQRFLDSLGFRSFNKNLNLRYSYGKIKWRPWAKGMRQIATSPGSYNKEILILEKERNGKPFKLHTDFKDLVSYYKSIRNMHLTNIILVIAFIISSFLPYFRTNNIIAFRIAMAILGVIISIPTIMYTRIVLKYKNELKTYE
ncbi:hypothetical protein BD780_001106 [Clostridium tetanomorphum]|uniref:DUF2812 domain-containing protein n=1 Tax=Clostridium tetanomorphum TaxID=1553 RepID=UPI00044F45CE|nr:DUF2812 domain-containing protein [Clostridium tetanomorphum]KAJ49613.1 hypothetical protein CTM_21998 [Clostridium tetanomorphum DSM 665]KAJ52454.1 hypothetical protein CTM_08156 [Clostridium tetanomorphum DSM 665]MBP1864703.1 hypothetical protein [Clostridium tetanomorphum]NRS83881.1 hypothetical protein [Clostridium tetanomorphum]SQB93180.1 Protein of uncharacterised function (DUF2812) [Clostridium tetanomorphum]